MLDTPMSTAKQQSDVQLISVHLELAYCMSTIIINFIMHISYRKKGQRSCTDKILTVICSISSAAGS